MKSRKSYQRTAVKDVCVETLVEHAILGGDAGTTVGLDIAKKEIVVVVRWGNGDYERPWSVINPDEIGTLIVVLQRLAETVDGVLRIGMESTGTYGEAARRALTLAQLDVQRVSGKAVADYAEIFDGVPSQHDGKDAAIIAELTAFGKCTAWPFKERSETWQELDYYVQRMDAYRKLTTMWLGRLESVLAEHWPELTEMLELGSPTLLQMLAHYGSRAQLAADPDAAQRLASWSNGKLASEKIGRVLRSTQTSEGVPACFSEETWTKEIATQALASYRQVQASKQKLEQLVKTFEPIQRMNAIGVPTMCVLWSAVGDPRDYGSSGAYLKAFGLNLKELSSGKRQGEVAITKRGPSRARRWLYFAALRAIQRDEVKPWYEAKQARDQKHGKMKGLVGVMRKLCRAIWHVSQTEEAFDWDKVFPGQPLLAAENPK